MSCWPLVTVWPWQKLMKLLLSLLWLDSVPYQTASMHLRSRSSLAVGAGVVAVVRGGRLDQVGGQGAAAAATIVVVTAIVAALVSTVVPTLVAAVPAASLLATVSTTAVVLTATQGVGEERAVRELGGFRHGRYAHEGHEDSLDVHIGCFFAGLVCTICCGSVERLCENLVPDQLK